MTDYNAGVLKATDNRRVTAYEEHESACDDVHWYENFRTYEGVITIDGQIRRWSAHSRHNPNGDKWHHDDAIETFGYCYSIRIDLAQWRKRKDTKAIRKAITEVITEETKRLDAEPKPEAKPVAVKQSETSLNEFLDGS